jgi:hypothetical protein
MLKKSYIGMKKVLAISMAVLFVVSLMGVAASADRGDRGAHGYVSGGYYGHRDSYYGGDESFLHHPYYHGHDYVNCDWVWDPSYTSQHIWTW